MLVRWRPAIFGSFVGKLSKTVKPLLVLNQKSHLVVSIRLRGSP